MEGELAQAGDPRIETCNQMIVEASQELIVKERKEDRGGGEAEDGGKRRKVNVGNRTTDQEQGSGMTDAAPGPTSSQD